MTASPKEHVRRFIGENFYVREPSALRDDASLLDEGVVDSTGVLELVDYLEETFGIEVDDAELVPDNLDSLDRIEAFIERKMRQAEQARQQAKQA